MYLLRCISGPWVWHRAPCRDFSRLPSFFSSFFFTQRIDLDGSFLNRFVLFRVRNFPRLYRKFILSCFSPLRVEQVPTIIQLEVIRIENTALHREILELSALPRHAIDWSFIYTYIKINWEYASTYIYGEHFRTSNIIVTSIPMRSILKTAPMTKTIFSSASGIAKCKKKKVK